MVWKVNAATPINNSNYGNDEAGPSGVASLPQKALMSINHHLTAKANLER